MDSNPIAVDMEEMVMEPSEEFPILFGLLTESNNKKGQSRITYPRPHPRRAVFASHHSTRGRKSGSSGNSVIVEPDSSTPDDPSDLAKSSLFQYQNNNSASASPLLILRLTSNPNGVLAAGNSQKTHHSPSSKNTNRCPPVLQQFQVIQRRQRRHTNNKVISNDEDCTPSSTTADDDSNPVKKACFSLPRNFRNEITSFEPLSTITSTHLPCSSSSSSLSTVDPPMALESSLETAESCAYPILNRRLLYNPSQGTRAIISPQVPVNSMPTRNHPMALGNSNSSTVFLDRSDEGLQVYACSHCHLKFRRQFHLLRHAAIHEDKRDFRCSNCSTAFYQHDNLLSHQRNCNASSLKRAWRQTAMIQPNQKPRPPPRTLADLLDRPDDYEGKYCDEPLSRYVQLPSGLEISEVEHSRLPMRRAENSVMKKLASPPPRGVNFGERELSDEEPNPLAGEVYPCGHCKKEFETFSRLLKHTAAKHMGNVDGTFHFEIETFTER